MPGVRFTIEPVRTTADLDAIRRLFRDYVDSLGIDLGYQDFELEVNSLPGKYSPPGGELLLARDAELQPIGCVGLRPLSEAGVCEMKRLYVSPPGRGIGLGKALVNSVLERAQLLGYQEIRLDTLSSMVEAIGIYKKTGFKEIPAYYEAPHCNVFFSLQLIE